MVDQTTLVALAYVTVFEAGLRVSRLWILTLAISDLQPVGIGGQNRATFVTSTSSAPLSAGSRRKAVGVESESARRGTSPDRSVSDAKARTFECPGFAPQDAHTLARGREYISAPLV